MILHEQSLEVLKSINAAQIFLDIVGGAQPPAFLEDIFEAPSEYFLEDEAEEYTQGTLIPIFDDGGPSSATFFDPNKKLFLEMCMEEDPADCQVMQNWQQVLALMFNTIIEHNESDADLEQMSRTIGFQHHDAMIQLRTSTISSVGYGEWENRFIEFVGTL